MHVGGCVASAGRHKWRPYVWRFVRRGGGEMAAARGGGWDKRRGDIHVARVADACMRRLRCLPAVGRASQVAPLRVGGGLCGVAAKCRPRGLVACDKRGDKRRGDIHVARVAGACMRAVALPPYGRPGVTSGAPTCGGVWWFVWAVWVAWFGGGSGGVVCVVCGQSWLRLIFPLMRKRATMWALGMTMSPA